MKSRSLRTRGATIVHIYKRMHNHAEIIFTHTDPAFSLSVFRLTFGSGLEKNINIKSKNKEKYKQLNLKLNLKMKLIVNVL